MAHDVAIRAKARAMYEAGESLRDIAIILKVAYRSVFNWSDKEGWEKGSLAPALQQAERDTLLMLASRLGLTQTKVINKVQRLMEAEKTVFWQGTKVANVKDNGTQVAATSQAMDILKMKAPEKEAGTNSITIILERVRARRNA